MSILTDLANIVVNMSKVDIASTPNAKFISALLDALTKPTFIEDKVHSGFSYSEAKHIVLKMKIDLVEFDIDDTDWKRIVAGYSVLIFKLRVEYGIDGVLVFADQLSIKYHF